MGEWEMPKKIVQDGLKLLDFFKKDRQGKEEKKSDKHK